MSDKALEELIIEHPYSPFPLVRYTERPDTVAAHLYQGMFALLVDTSPSAILGPVSIFDHMTHAEEHRQTPLSGTYLRILRYIGILLSFLLMPLWFSIIEYKAIFPSFFQPLLVYESNRLIVFIQIIWGKWIRTFANGFHPYAQLLSHLDGSYRRILIGRNCHFGRFVHRGYRLIGGDFCYWLLHHPKL